MLILNVHLKIWFLANRPIVSVLDKTGMMLVCVAGMFVAWVTFSAIIIKIKRITRTEPPVNRKWQFWLGPMRRCIWICALCSLLARSAMGVGPNNWRRMNILMIIKTRILKWLEAQKHILMIIVGGWHGWQRGWLVMWNGTVITDIADICSKSHIKHSKITHNLGR